jgi:holo-[acyl-carrier protein] synthase
MTDIEICLQESGAPKLELSGLAAAAGRDAKLNSWNVSLSHDSGFVIAFVIGLGA